MGYSTYVYFCGDPDLPGEEDLEDGRLHLRRWCQWISALHRGGVYDGEEGKIRDWNYSLPSSLVDTVIGPAIADDKQVVILGEEWHTSWSMKLISDSLYYRGLRNRVVMLWNANNTYGFNRIDWPALNLATTVTTVSRYMKFRMWESKDADVINLTTFLSDSAVRAMYSASDAVLANSGHEPFGLVGLEVMAAGGTAVTGSTGEDYAEAYRNAVVLETDDPIEIVTELSVLKQRPRLAAGIRKRGRTTAP